MADLINGAVNWYENRRAASAAETFCNDALNGSSYNQFGSHAESSLDSALKEYPATKDAAAQVFAHKLEEAIQAKNYPGAVFSILGKVAENPELGKYFTPDQIHRLAQGTLDAQPTQKYEPFGDILTNVNKIGRSDLIQAIPPSLVAKGLDKTGVFFVSDVNGYQALFSQPQSKSAVTPEIRKAFVDKVFNSDETILPAFHLISDFSKLENGRGLMELVTPDRIKDYMAKHQPDSAGRPTIDLMKFAKDSNRPDLIAAIPTSAVKTVAEEVRKGTGTQYGQLTPVLDLAKDVPAWKKAITPEDVKALVDGELTTMTGSAGVRYTGPGLWPSGVDTLREVVKSVPEWKQIVDKSLADYLHVEPSALPASGQESLPSQEIKGSGRPNRASLNNVPAVEASAAPVPVSTGRPTTPRSVATHHM